MTLQERQAYSFLTATRMLVACDFSVKGAAKEEQEKLYVHAEFSLQQVRPPSSERKRKSSARKMEGTPERSKSASVGSTKFSVKFRTSFAGAFRGSVEAYIQNEAYKALSVWRERVLEKAPHKEQHLGPSQPPSEEAGTDSSSEAYYPSHRKNMFEISQKPYVKNPRDGAGAKRVQQTLAREASVASVGDEEFFDPDDTIQLEELGLTEEESHQSMFSLITGLQRETAQLRELLLASQSRVMALELAMQEQLRAEGSKKTGQAASDAAGSFRLYYKQMAELYSEMNEMEERREKDWARKVEALGHLLPSSPATSPRGTAIPRVPSSAGDEEKKSPGGFRLGYPSASAVPLHRRRETSAAFSALKWAAVGGAAAGAGVLLALFIQSRTSSSAIA